MGTQVVASTPAKDRVRKRLRPGAIWLVVSLLVALTAYVFWPRTVHLREFDPDRVAQLETRMWRSYYEKHYAALLFDLYRLSRDEYGFSPADSLAVSWYAARAAQTFQPTRSRAEAQQALPLLERYFAVIRARGGETFEVQDAARLELDWWQLRRESSPPVEYGAVIARVSALLFGGNNADIERAGRLRAEMMTFRDQHGEGRMQEEDWAHIERQLALSYRSLHEGVARR